MLKYIEEVLFAPIAFEKTHLDDANQGDQLNFSVNVRSKQFSDGVKLQLHMVRYLVKIL